MLLAAKGTSKRFGPNTVLQNAGFSVRDGEVLGLIGPNGAGKTTLFECLAGLTIWLLQHRNSQFFCISTKLLPNICVYMFDAGRMPGVVITSTREWVRQHGQAYLRNWYLAARKLHCLPHGASSSAIAAICGTARLNGSVSRTGCPSWRK